MATATRTAPSLKPALVVVAAAAAIVVLGSVLALVGTSSARPTASNGPSVALTGTKLRAQSASALIGRIASDDEPPADVRTAVEVPAGSRYLGKKDEDAGVSQFDRSVEISVDEPEATVANFFVRMLSANKWVTQSITTPKAGSRELIAERSGSDGYQWRVGITTSGVNTVVAPALAGGDESASRTNVTIELYQVEDAS